jgi:hypothetical protein
VYSVLHCLSKIISFTLLFIANFTAAIINLIFHGSKAHLLTVSKKNLEKTILVPPFSTVLDVDLLLNLNQSRATIVVCSSDVAFGMVLICTSVFSRAILWSFSTSTAQTFLEEIRNEPVMLGQSLLCYLPNENQKTCHPVLKVTHSARSHSTYALVQTRIHLGQDPTTFH